MSKTARPIIVILGFALAMAPLRAHADDPSTSRDAGKHFQRAVALYNEADYRAALVEFKRAYAISPNAAVLYNIGEAEYQLQDYAAALVTFEHFLAESGPAETRRAEVENNVEVLRARVGHLTVTTVPAGADVSVDDIGAGRTPLDKSILVSIGHRKVTASLPGRPPNLALRRRRGRRQRGRHAAVAAAARRRARRASGPPSSRPTRRRLRTPPRRSVPNEWIGAGALAAGAATFGVLAIRESSELRDARASFPTSAATLSHDSSMTSTYSTLADSLGAAALVVGGIALVSTLTASSPSTTGTNGAGTRLMLGPTSARLQVTF